MNSSSLINKIDSLNFASIHSEFNCKFFQSFSKVNVCPFLHSKCDSYLILLTFIQIIFQVMPILTYLSNCEKVTKICFSTPVLSCWLIKISFKINVKFILKSRKTISVHNSKWKLAATYARCKLNKHKLVFHSNEPVSL